MTRVGQDENLKNLGAVTNSSRGVWALTGYGRTATESELVQRDKAWRKELAAKLRPPGPSRQPAPAQPAPADVKPRRSPGGKST